MPFVEEARRAADSEKNALGFLPEVAFREAANQGKLLIAVVRGTGGEQRYAGHLLHGGAFPHAKIFQIFTDRRFRGRGIGRQLVETIVQKSTREQFMSVSARVAADLTANGFWERLGFGTVRRTPGRGTNGRQINVRVRDLGTPSLFIPEPGPPAATALGFHLASFSPDITPIYVLDLNVLLDLLKSRANARDVGRIVRASLGNLVRLAVTEELIKELERNSKPSPTDAILQFALALPRLPAPPDEVLNHVAADLSHAIFAASSPESGLRTQDRSDLAHLATAIHSGASGFVTSEKAILRAREIFRADYSLDVMGPSELADYIEPVEQAEVHHVCAASEGLELQARPAGNADMASVREFLLRMRCPQDLLQDALAADLGRRRRRTVVLCDGLIVGLGLWEVPSRARPLPNMFVCVDEDHEAIRPAADFLLGSAAKTSSSRFPVRLTLRLLPGNVVTKRIASAHGFCTPADGASGELRLQKIALGRVMFSRNWASGREMLKEGLGLELPLAMPQYESLRQPIRIQGPGGPPADIPLEDLESLFSPAIFILPGRTGAIAPIRRVYADDLIGGATQLRLQPSPEAVMLRERVYFSSPRTAQVLRRGTPVLFYESASGGGRASAVAIARVSRAELVSKRGAPDTLLRRGVLPPSDLQKICLGDTLGAFSIDTITPFKRPLPLARLRRLGAIDRSNLVTARPLEAARLAQIVEEGMG